MGRFWVGIFLLILFLLLGLWIGNSMQQLHNPVCAQLDQAGARGLEGDLPESYAHFLQAKTLWQKNWSVTAAVSDHAPMDEVDSLFAQAEAHAKAGQPRELASFCLRLSQLIRAIAEAHSLHWWSLL